MSSTPLTSAGDWLLSLRPEDLVRIGAIAVLLLLCIWYEWWSKRNRLVQHCPEGQATTNHTGSTGLVQNETERPFEQGRYQILKKHTKKMKLARDVNLRQLAKRTKRFSDADLEALTSTAASFAHQRQEAPDTLLKVTMEDMNQALVKVKKTLGEQTLGEQMQHSLQD